MSDSEILVGLSDGELEALAQGVLAPSTQGHLDNLLERNRENRLSPEETAELDQLLAQLDQLTVLKSRARYTFHQRSTTNQNSVSRRPL